MNPEVKKRLLECGYDYGFECPHFESTDTYPDYIRETVENGIKRIKAAENENTFTFAFMTDIHYLPMPHHDVLLQRNANAYRQIEKETGCTKLILGGDYIIDSPREKKAAGYAGVKEAFREFDYFPCNGNHDNGNLWDRFMEREKPFDKFTRKEIFDAFYSGLSERGARFDENKDNGLYYYVDDDKTRVRYICLDICNAPDYYDETLNGVHSFGQDQIDWFINVALQTEYDIIINTHSVLRPIGMTEDEKAKNQNSRLEILNFIVDAYKKGEKLSGTLYEDDLKVTVSADFGAENHGEIIAVMVGHFHRDYLMATDSGIPYIATANLFLAECHEPRNIGDETELLFDVATVDREARKITVTRIGSGEDRTINY